ncbi:MAG TPA: DedA family protein [Gaiellaceae bacterium]
MTHFLLEYGLPLLFVAVMLESFGIPVPGETALIAFSVVASQGRYSIVSVVAVAAAAAIVGDNLGYWLIGRLGGRSLLHRWGWLGRYADHALPRAEGLLERHGGAIVFGGRFVSVLRETIAWVAGLSGMSWWRFLFWNATGGIAWAAAIGVLAYYAGEGAAAALGRYSVAAAVLVGVVAGGAWLAHKLAHRRRSSPEPR